MPLSSQSSPTPLLAELASLGRFFTVTTGRPPQSAHPFADLHGDDTALADRIEGTALRLRLTEARVAASIMFQGLTARIWSPLIGVYLLYDLLLDLRDLAWSPAPGGATPLHLAAPSFRRNSCCLYYRKPAPNCADCVLLG
ncbi:(2Fe-2S)-binding protein [Actinoallomurus acaciae]|uniref:(2Fe-2S)-binding protein n=1 Tax=Actinoallomurus acaciae TaxID=502577 RepID=A0ABV5YD24_9ACTN